jgi:SPP1 family predicted phage head-tail adaptor
MIASGRLNQRIKVQRKVVTRDAYGGEVANWVTESEVFAEVEPWQMRDRIAARREQGESVVSFLVRSPLTVSLGRRVVYQNSNYDIEQIDSTRNSKGELFLVCRAEDTAP